MPSFRSASPISPSSEPAPRLGHPAAALAYKLALSPLLVVQALATRRHAQKLPEATGERTGFVGVIGVAPIRLLIAGDSSAAGVGVADQREAVAGHLVRTAHRAIGRPVAWQLSARSGLTTHGLHALLEAERPEAADVAIVVTGVNDVVEQVSARRALGHRRALAEWLLGKGLARHVVFAPLPPIHRFPLLPEPLRSVMGRDALRHDQALAEWAATRADVSHAEIALELHAGVMASDGFHPGEPVYRMCGEALGRKVAEIAAALGLDRERVDDSAAVA